MSLQVKQGTNLHNVDTIHVKRDGILKEIAEVYQVREGALAQVYQNVIELTIAADKTNLNMATWLGQQGVKAGANVIVTIPAGVTIGGNTSGGFALWMGDTRRYKSVHIVLSGSILGKGGVPTSRWGSHCIRAHYPFSLTVNSTGKIYSGGGAGGKGGNGGSGNFINYGAWQSAWDTSAAEKRRRWDQEVGADGCKVLWDNTQVYYELYTPKYVAEGGVSVVLGNDAYYYQRSLVHDWPPRFWNIRRGKYKNGVAGAGTNGGNGRGYGQQSSSGADRVTENIGTGGAGNGGIGGAGGGWGTNGALGSFGDAGNVGAASTWRQGVAEAGYSIYAPNVDVFIRNNGAKLGRENYLWRAQT